MAVKHRKTSQICTTEQYWKLKSIHRRFERRSSLSEYQKTMLAADLRASFYKIREIIWRLEYAEHTQHRKTISYRVEDNLKIFEKLIYGDEITWNWLVEEDICKPGPKTKAEKERKKDQRVKDAKRWFHEFMLTLDNEFGSILRQKALNTIADTLGTMQAAIKPVAETDQYTQIRETDLQINQDSQYQKKSQKIPQNYRSSPVSLKRMSECIGGDMTPKKLRVLINNGVIKVMEYNRQTFFFDTRDWSDEVVNKLKH